MTGAPEFIGTFWQMDFVDLFSTISSMFMTKGPLSFEFVNEGHRQLLTIKTPPGLSFCH